MKGVDAAALGPMTGFSPELVRDIREAINALTPLVAAIDSKVDHVTALIWRWEDEATALSLAADHPAYMEARQSTGNVELWGLFGQLADMVRRLEDAPHPTRSR